MVHEAAVWGQRECDGFLVDALAPVPVGEGGLVPVGEGGPALGEEDGPAHGGEGGPAPGREGGPALGEEEGDSLFLQILGLVLHYCSLVEVAVGSSGCVWDQMVPFLPVAMVCQGRRRSKVWTLLPSTQEEAWEVLP